MDKVEIARNWLPRYTGMPLEEFGDHILLTNFSDYLNRFAERCRCEGIDRGDAVPVETIRRAIRACEAD